MEHDMCEKNSRENLVAWCVPGNLYSLAMAYVPDQVFEDLYEADVGWNRGTIFKQLDLPFLGAMGGCKR